MNTTHSVTHTKTNVATALIVAAVFVAAAIMIVSSQECNETSLACFLPRTTVQLIVEQDDANAPKVKATAMVSKQRRGITSGCYGQEWDWGDGSKTASTPLCAKNAKSTAAAKTYVETHTYSKSGTFTVRMTLTSGDKTVAESNSVSVTARNSERRIQ